MKSELFAEFFKTYVEEIPIIKRCRLDDNNRAIIELKDGSIITLLLAVLENGYPQQVNNLVSHMNTADMYCVVVAPYISEQTAKICKEADMGYFDMAGNCLIANGQIYIEIKGNKNKNVSKRALKSIYERSSVVSSMILRTMLDDVSRAWKLKDLAQAVGCSIGQVAKVKDFLTKQAYVEQTPSGIRIIEPRAVMKDWAEVYNRNVELGIACYSLDNVALLEAKIARLNKEIGTDCALTGFSGGSRYQPVVRYQKVHVYVDTLDVKKVINHLGLKRVESGANVILIIPYNDCVKYNSKIRKDNMVVSPVQLYLDCMGIKGRGEEMAEAILEREICK